ncbi:MAG: TonB-dependent receptor [Woeseiaceae bacterium]|nr:TonB-dependent receptor [Woeseiaceae bacterium]
MFVDQVRAVPARLLKNSFLATLFLSLAAPIAVAQETAQEDARDDAVEEVVVTGSRIKRDTFSSIAPLQVISGQVSREAGTIDPSTILQETTSASGQQIDITYQGFVTANGPGASTIDLRGLGQARTLVLINGRRAAPVGVEGAPFAVDLNVIPSSLVDRYEILTDGASSTYGSDAIAGVANIILRKDFEGFEFEAYQEIPEHSDGTVTTLNAAWGYTGDRGFFGIAADYSEAERVQRRDRPWSENCESYREITTDGEIRTTFIGYALQYGMNTSDCRVGFGTQRVFDNEAGLFGSIYYTPGTTNTGIPNFSEATLFDAVVDVDGDGLPDVDFTDYFITDEDTRSDLFPDRDRLSVMSYGEYTFDGEMNVTPYFEFNYNQRETFAQSTAGSASSNANPVNVPGSNPFNPCNPNQPDGVDCGLAWDSVITNPGYIEKFRDRYEPLCAQFGFDRASCTPGLFGIVPTGGVGPITLEPQVSVVGDRDNVLTDIEQYRFVGGVTADLPMFNVGFLDNWSMDLSVVHSESTGESNRRGIRDDLLRYSVDTTVIDPNTGEPVCGTDTTGDGIPDSNDCVPVNMFAPTLYENLIENDFATQAERDFLFDDRKYDTEYKQTLFTLLFTGDLWNMAGGDAAMALGYEHRIDEIDSIPNDVARDGLLIGFFRDLGAVGEKTTKEAFAELELPFFAGNPGMEELTVNIGSRYTDDEFYGGAWTYSAKLAYRPVDSLLIRGTVGTSYRAPNLRENFLQGTSGFLGLFDPCVTPDSAIELDPMTGGFNYNPAGETRTQTVLDNCVAAGVDPTNLGITSGGQSIDTYSVEILRGVGTNTLDEEKSESWTAGFAWDQPFFDSFDMTLGATYYEVEVTDEIVTLASQSSINQCYDDAEGDSPFCTNITRRLDSDGLINQVDEAFLNRDALKTRGVDINLALDIPTQLFGQALDLGFDFNFNRKLEFTTFFIDREADFVSSDSDLGQFGFPEWEGQGRMRADMGNYRFTWNTRYIGSVAQDPDIRAANDFDSYPTMNTCGGWILGVGPDPDADVQCRPVGEADNYFRHDTSFYYLGDTWTIGVGVRNVTDEAPPRVDRRVVFSRWNIPFGAGYDLNGRSYFFNVAARFQ